MLDFGARLQIIPAYARLVDNTDELYGQTIKFYVFAHPGDILYENDVSIRVPFSEEIHISIKPTLTTTSDGLRSYPIESRQCFFNSERQLKFFKFYSQNNCKIECLANYTLQKCDCVKFNMPSTFA